MADMLATGVAWQVAQLQGYASRSIVYRRGMASVTINATLGRKLLQVTDPTSGDVLITHADRDYLIPASVLVLSAQTVKPARGDLIDDDGDRYEVVPPGPGEKEWQYGDGHNAMLRVFTKYIGAVPA